MTIYNNIKKIMTEKNITIDALAQKTNLSIGTIKRARADQIIDCRFSTLITIADALEVQVKDLFDENIELSKELAQVKAKPEHFLRSFDSQSIASALRQSAGTERASEVAKRLHEEQAERLRKVAESAAYNAIVEFEHKWKEEQEEAIKKAGIPPVGSIF
jgi:DNA-binding Xre family transcriptional regulator